MSNGQFVSTIFILQLFIQGVTTVGVVCSSNIAIIPSAPHTHAGQSTTPLTISNMELGKTVCFTVTDKDSGLDTHYGLKLEGIYAITGWETFYEFAVPNVVTKCTCVCKVKILTDGCEPQDLCKGLGGDDICVAAKKSITDNTCYMGGKAEACCALRIEENLIDTRYVWFKMRSNDVEHMFQLLFYKINLIGNGEEAEAEFTHSEMDLEKGQSRAFDNKGQFSIYDVTVESTNSVEQPNFDDHGYIGKSSPLESEVQDYKLDVNLRNGHDLDKAGWAKYQNGKYEINAIPDSEFLDELEQFKVKSCNSGDTPNITVQFPSPSPAKFTSLLAPLHEKYTDITKIDWYWNDNSVREGGGVKWWYSAQNEIKADVKIKMLGDISVGTFSTAAYLGEFTVRIGGTKHGENYMEIKTKGSLGHIYAVFNAQNLEKKFDFEITNKTLGVVIEKSSQFYCNNDQSGYHGNICFDLNDDKIPRKCVTVTNCKIEKKSKIEYPDSGTEAEMVSSDDPLSLKSWAKFLNPAEWFKGELSVQEIVIMIVELAGVCGGIFLVIKVLRMLNMLNKCCRCMFCCCLCPKTEKKLKDKASKTRARLDTAYTEKKRSIRDKSVSFSENVRVRLTTSAAMVYLKRKMERSREFEVSMLELETGPSNGEGGDAKVSNGEGGHAKVNYAYQNSVDHGLDKLDDGNANVYTK